MHACPCCAAGAKPAAGADVSIPGGWALVIDESPPPLGRVVIEGNMSFSPRRDVTLTAAAVIVRANGSLTAGSAAAPHPRRLELLLTGGRSSPNILISAGLNAGTKVLAAVQGGSVALWGAPVGARWTKLAASAAAGVRGGGGWLV